MSRPLAEQAGRLLSQFREKAGHSRREMAREIGVADTTLLHLELGRANPTLARLERVAKAYGIRLKLVAELRRRDGK
jgi:transcriptional regulator with XRE-family HTH domain